MHSWSAQHDGRGRGGTLQLQLGWVSQGLTRQPPSWWLARLRAWGAALWEPPSPWTPSLRLGSAGGGEASLLQPGPKALGSSQAWLLLCAWLPHECAAKSWGLSWLGGSQLAGTGPKHGFCFSLREAGRAMDGQSACSRRTAADALSTALNERGRGT